MNEDTNSWSLLSCLVEEQEKEDSPHTGLEHLMLVTPDHPPPQKQNKTTAKWKQKIANCSGIMGTGCTSGVGAKHNVDCFYNTGLPSGKVFMLPNQNVNQDHQQDDVEAQPLAWGKQGQHCTEPTLYTNQYTQNGQCQLCYGVRQGEG